MQREKKKKKLNDVEEEKNMKAEGDGKEMQKKGGGIQKERNSALSVITFSSIPKTPETKL